MARAKRIPPAQPDIELSLTQKEAQFLFDVLYRIGGHPSASRRRFADGIQNALSGVGLVYQKARDISESQRAIYFEDEK